MTLFMLDTCTLTWQATGNTTSISPQVESLLRNPGSMLAVSTISFIEIAFKINAGRLVCPKCGYDRMTLIHRPTQLIYKWREIAPMRTIWFLTSSTVMPC
jgi:PIN domain nuclease of toxin-antitoxin system